MRKYVLGTAALIALARPAIAADFADPVYGAPPVWHWTGCYAGGHAGGLGGSSEKWIVRTPGGDFQGQSLGGHDVDSFIGGVQAGCDYQFAGGIVIGIQGDHGWTNAGGSHPSTREFGVSYHSKVESLTSVTGRIGYAWDRYLGYFKSGGAWEEVDYSASTIGRATRARDGPLVPAANVPSPSTCLSSSNIPITTSAPRTFVSRRNSSDCARGLSISRRPRTSRAPVSTCASAARRLVGSLHCAAKHRHPFTVRKA